MDAEQSTIALIANVLLFVGTQQGEATRSISGGPEKEEKGRVAWAKLFHRAGKYYMCVVCLQSFFAPLISRCSYGSQWSLLVAQTAQFQCPKQLELPKCFRYIAETLRNGVKN